jgi:hypothetical protein
VAGPYTPLRFLGESKVQIQFAIAGGRDTQALGLMGLNGALTAAAVAAKDILEHLWYTSLFGLLVSTGLCVVVLAQADMKTGLDLTVMIPSVGSYDEQSMEQTVTVSLAEARTKNEPVLKAKQRLIVLAIGVLVLTLVWAAIAAAEIS